MTDIKQVDPESIRISEINERKTVAGTDSLEKSAGEIGIVEPPKVREIDDDEYNYEVIVGQRRVLAAQEALDTVEVIVGSWSDEECLKMSITENIADFKENVSATDRGEALLTLWEMIEEDLEGKPSATKLSEELSVPTATVNTWLETVRDRWKDSRTVTESVDSSDNQKQETIADKLGERKLEEIRKATESQEESDRVAKKVLEENFSQSQVKELRTYLEEGQNLDTAVESVKQEEEEQPQSFTDFSNISDDTEDEQEVQEIEDPTEVTEETGQDEIVQQIQTVDTVELTVEGEIEFTVEIPEKTVERAEEFASDFDYETVEEFLLVNIIPDFFEEDGTEHLIDQIERKAKKRGY